VCPGVHAGALPAGRCQCELVSRSVTGSVTMCVQVCTQVLCLPAGVSVNSASVAAGHLSSASIYPACFAPYLLTTACSNGHVLFWRCELTSPADDAPLQSLTYVWKEWEMMIPKEASSRIRVQGVCSYR